jgi:hypothetical protein
LTALLLVAPPPWCCRWRPPWSRDAAVDLRAHLGPAAARADTVPWPDCAFCTLKAALVVSTPAPTGGAGQAAPAVLMLLPFTATVLPVARLP